MVKIFHFSYFISVLWDDIFYWQCSYVFMEQRPDFIEHPFGKNGYNESEKESLGI